MFGFGKPCKWGHKQDPLIVVIDERGRVSSERSGEPGIRFLDDDPSPAVSTSNKARTTESPNAEARGDANTKANASGGWPVTTLVFLGVVVGGVALNEVGLLDLERSRVESPVVKEFELTTGASLRVESFNGPIQVRRGASDMVRCEVVRIGEAPTQQAARAIAEGIVVETQREEAEGVERLTLKVSAPDVQPGFSALAEVRVEAPADMAIDLKAQNGSVDVRDWNGQVAAHTNNGSINIRGGRGQYLLASRNGSVMVEARDAVVQASTDNGRIEFRGDFAPGESKLENRNGSIKVKLSPNQSIELDASTINGSIKTDLVPKRPHRGPGRDRDHDRDRPKHVTSLIKTLGEHPQASLVMRTINGSIEVGMERRD